jgi:L-alanine-DL-glutamate epimerase-like enolase superfamily enzyme
MKITNVTCYPVWNGSRNFLFVVVDTDEGLFGVGESGLTGRELAVMGAVEHYKPMLIWQDATRIEHLWQGMSRGGFFPHGRILGSAIAAIDIALWDLRGKALGVPVYDLLGGRVRDKVACYCHLAGGHTPGTEALIEDAQKRIAEGWKYLRWGLPSEGELLEPSRAVRQAVTQFRALRQAVGDEIELCFDIHTRLNPPDAIHLCREVEPYRPYFMEDALRSESPQAYHLVREKVNVPLAIGEQFASKWEFRELIDHDLMDYARIDLCICAGFTEGKKIAGWCEGHFIDIAVHNPLGPVSTAACVQFNLAIPNFGVQEQPRRPGTMLTEVVPNQPVWEDGFILPPKGPGLGIEFNREAAAGHALKISELTHLHREDGSFTNW